MTGSQSYRRRESTRRYLAKAAVVAQAQLEGLTLLSADSTFDIVQLEMTGQSGPKKLDNGNG